MIAATKPTLADYSEYIEEIKSIWNTGILTNNGPKVGKLTSMLKEYTGCSNAQLFVNGHSALLACIKVMELPDNGEVLTSPFTFTSTTNAIVQSGLTPVFCDIDDSYNISCDSIRRNITKNTCAIITPHIFGIPCNVNEIEKIAREYNLRVIYDGAQAFGTKIKGVDVGIFGDATMFSLHAIKVYNSIEGGLLTYSDSSLTDRLERIRNFGIEYGEINDLSIVGYNFKMNEFSAAMGIVNYRHIEEEIEKRAKIASLYSELLTEIDGITVYNYNEDIRYNHSYYPILIEEKSFGKDRDYVWKAFKSKEIFTRKLYDRLTCDYSVFSNCGYRKDVENARRITKMCLDLPIYGTMKSEDVRMIVAELKNIKGIKK